MPSATIEHERKWGGGRIFCYENSMSVGWYSRLLIGRFFPLGWWRRCGDGERGFHFHSEIETSVCSRQAADMVTHAGQVPSELPDKEG